MLAETCEPTFCRSLSQVIAWCATRNLDGESPASLRSSELYSLPVKAEFRHSFYPPDIPALQKISRERTVLLEKSGYFPSNSCELHGGRLLAYEIDLGFGDQRASDYTSGFFDAEDFPPWDTWIYFLKYGFSNPKRRKSGVPILVSWIPPFYFELAQKGIDVHPFKGLNWVTEDQFNFLKLHVDTDLP